MTFDAAAFERTISRFHEANDIPGLVVGVVDGEAVHIIPMGRANLDAASEVTEHTAFRIASMTKSFIALTLLRLRDEGALRLDDEARRYVPELARLDSPTSDAPPITLRHLLCHLAGFVNDDAWADRQLAMTNREFEALLQNDLAAARPTAVAFEYANVGYAILGLVISRIAGVSFQDEVRTRLLRPLGMTATSFDRPAAGRYVAAGYRRTNGAWIKERFEDDGAFGAIGGLITTAADFARYCDFLLNAWPSRDEPETGPIRRATVRELGLGFGPPRRDEWTHPDGTTVVSAGVYGHGMVCSVDPILRRHIHHDGGLPGYGSHVLLLPETHQAIFAFGNRTYAPMSELTRALGALIVSRAERANPDPSDPALEAVCIAVERAFDASNVATIAVPLADNFLDDRSLDERSQELTRLRERVGARRSVSREVQHRHAVRLTFACERGTIRADVRLTPLIAPSIQYLEWTHIEEPARRT